MTAAYHATLKTLAWWDSQAEGNAWQRGKAGRKSFVLTVASGCAAFGPVSQSRLPYAIGIVGGLNESEKKADWAFDCDDKINFESLSVASKKRGA